MKPLVVNERVTIPSTDLSWTASRSSGPGGQNVNKLSTKVTLRFDLARTASLTQTQKRRLKKLAGRRLATDGSIVVSAQVERSQAQNLERARGTLRKLVRKALVAPKRRVATKPSRSQRRRRLEEKRRVSDKKQGRRPVRVVD